MSTKLLRTNTIEDGARPKDWQHRRSGCKVPFRLLRLCLLGAILPAALVAGPMYLRYRVYSEQLYPVAISDQRLIDGRVSTTWCQRQIVRVNATFNAYLMKNAPNLRNEILPVSMTRHLVLEDDMKEYWGFYLLRGSSVTVSTCVRWPGASLTIIRGHKHLHECAFIGDDSSEELDELLEVAKEQGLLPTNGTEIEGPSNEPGKMTRAKQGVHFHLENGTFRALDNLTKGVDSHHHNSHELDANAMRNILNHLFVKTLDTKKKQKEHPHHHYEGVFVESRNIDKPLTNNRSLYDEVRAQQERNKAGDAAFIADNSDLNHTKLPNIISNSSFEKNSSDKVNSRLPQQVQKRTDLSDDNEHVERVPIKSSTTERKTISKINSTARTSSSAEVFQDVLQKISSLGVRGKHMLRRLMDEIDSRGDGGETFKKMVNDTMNDGASSYRRRARRDFVLSSPLHKELTEEDDDGDAAVEKDTLHPDGIAEDRGTVDERTLNDKSNSEFWSSFSSSEERLLECKGLILNLPLTPHRYCTPKHESQHSEASFANTITYRVPTDGYYFFVFNSENEIQPNYLRVRFDLLKTTYNTSDAVQTCTNSTSECSLPFTIFSNERTVLELPLSGNDSQWNEEYVVVSTCEPRTSVYLFCIIMVPLLILFFAFH